MKKFLVSFLALCGLLFPLLAQVDHDFDPNDRIPLVNTTITKDQVPAEVLKAVNTQFDKNNVLTWSKFPFALKEYGWVYDAGASDIPLNRYEVKMQTSTGDELWAIYSPKGELVQTREVFKNSIVPQNVMESLANSQYKDWKVIGDREVLRFYHDHDNASVEQHYRLTVEKDKVKRTISFNYQNKANLTE